MSESAREKGSEWKHGGKGVDQSKSMGKQSNVEQRIRGSGKRKIS